MMQIKTEQKEKALVLSLHGNLDADSVSAFKKTSYKLVEEGMRFLVIDCSELGFIDSTGLGALISLLRKLRMQNGDLKVAGLNNEVRSVFEITRLHRLFDILPNVQTACEKF